jgi:hypothetical protein
MFCQTMLLFFAVEVLKDSNTRLAHPIALLQIVFAVHVHGAIV